MNEANVFTGTSRFKKSPAKTTNKSDCTVRFFSVVLLHFSFARPFCPKTWIPQSRFMVSEWQINWATSQLNWDKSNASFLYQTSRIHESSYYFWQMRLQKYLLQTAMTYTAMSVHVIVPPVTTGKHFVLLKKTPSRLVISMIRRYQSQNQKLESMNATDIQILNSWHFANTGG